MEILREIPKEEKDRRGCAYCAFAKLKIGAKNTDREYQYLDKDVRLLIAAIGVYR